MKESQNQLNATYVIIVPLRPFVFLKLQAGLVHVLRTLNQSQTITQINTSESFIINTHSHRKAMAGNAALRGIERQPRILS